MATIQLTLTDLELVGIGLVGDWDVLPVWLADALARLLREDPAALVLASRQNAQLGLLEDVLLRTGLWDEADRATQDAISSFNAGTVLLTRVLDQGIAEIDYVLSRLSIPVTYLKGPVTSTRYYRQRWHRWSKDIDLMVEPEHALRVYATMGELGYVQGRYDARRRGIARTNLPVDVVGDPRAYELPRQTRLVPVELGPSSPVELLRQESERFHLEGRVAVVPIQLEVHHALEPDRRVPARVEPAALRQAPHGLSLDPESMLVYLAFKAYVDLMLLGARGGVKIFADLVRVVEHERGRIAWAGLVSRYHPVGLCSALKYALHHAVHVYGARIDPAVVGGCECGDATTGPLDLGDPLPAMTRGRRPFSLVLVDP